MRNALDRFLTAILGAAYRPERHLGGAVYLFLRAMTEEDDPENYSWSDAADAAGDRRYVESLLRRGRERSV